MIHRIIKTLIIGSVVIFSSLASDAVSSEEILSKSQFYVNRPFFDLEVLFENSPELCLQYASLSREDQLALIEAFEQFNADILMVFHSLLENE